MKTVPCAAALAIALLAQGCAQMQWTKDGADAATVARDQNECRVQALRRAPPPVAGMGSPDARTGPGRPVVMAPASSNERFVAEHEEMSRCMQQRGYALKPAS